MGFQTHTGRSRLGAADPKMIAAAVFCGGGVLWGAYAIYGSVSGGAAEERGPRELEGAFDAQGNTIDASYERAGSAKAVERVADEIGVSVNTQAGEALRAMNLGVGTPEGVSSAVRDAFVPILMGDHDAFVDAILAMGGSLSEDLDDDHPLFTHLSRVFEGADVDVSRVSVSKYEPPVRRGGGRMEMVVEEEAGGGGEGAPGRGVNMNVMEMNPQSVFPDAPGKDDPSALEVKIPVRPKGEKNESVFGLVLTWNAELGLWQPAAYQLTTITVTEGGEP